MVDAPAVQQGAEGKDAEDHGEGGLEAVLGQAGAAAADDPPLHDGVGDAAAGEAANEEAQPGGEVEETAGEGGVEAEAGVDDVADGGEDAVLVHGEEAAADVAEEDARVGEKAEDDEGVDGGADVGDGPGLGGGLGGAGEVAGARDEGEGQGEAGDGHDALDAEDDAPGAEGGYDAADEGGCGAVVSVARFFPFLPNAKKSTYRWIER